MMILATVAFVGLVAFIGKMLFEQSHQDSMKAIRIKVEDEQPKRRR